VKVTCAGANYPRLQIHHSNNGDVVVEIEDATITDVSYDADEATIEVDVL
jgi:hypothetical protein